MFRILWARQRRTGMDGGQGGGEVVAAVRTDHFEALADGRAPVEGGGRSHSAALSPRAGWKSMIPLRPSGRRPRATVTGRLSAPAPVLRADTTPSGLRTS